MSYRDRDRGDRRNDRDGGGSRRPPETDEMISLKVDNLTYKTTPESLKRVFDRYGDVGDVYIPRDPYTQDSRGFAFVRYYDQRDADDAIDAMDGQMLDGRPLRVQLARHARPQQSGFRRGSGGPPRRRRHFMRELPTRRNPVSDNRSSSRSRSRSRGRRHRSRSNSKSRSRSAGSDKKTRGSHSRRDKDRSRDRSRDKDRSSRDKDRHSRDKDRSSRDKDRSKSRSGSPANGKASAKKSHSRSRSPADD